jgi:hypothetical protein
MVERRGAWLVTELVVLLVLILGGTKSALGRELKETGECSSTRWC